MFDTKNTKKSHEGHEEVASDYASAK